jgi:hypothetical protein
MKTGNEKKTVVLLHLKALGALSSLVLGKLSTHLEQDPISRGALGYGLLRLYLNFPMTTLLITGENL